MRWLRHVRAWLLGPARREHIERYEDMAGDLIFNDASISVTVQALNIYGNPSEVTQRLSEIAESVNSLRETQMATAQELQTALDEMSTAIDGVEAAVNNAEARLTSAITSGQTGADLQAVVDASFSRIKNLTGRVTAAKDDLDDGKDEANTPPDTGGGTTPPDTGTDIGGGATPPDDGTGTTFRRR